MQKLSGDGIFQGSTHFQEGLSSPTSPIAYIGQFRGIEFGLKFVHLGSNFGLCVLGK